MTEGTLHSLACPYCGAAHDPCPDGAAPAPGAVLMYGRECPLCERPFYVTVVCEVVTRAERIAEDGSTCGNDSRP